MGVGHREREKRKSDYDEDRVEHRYLSRGCGIAESSCSGVPARVPEIRRAITSCRVWKVRSFVMVVIPRVEKRPLKEA